MKWQFETLNFESDVFDAPVGRIVPCLTGGDELSTLVQTWQTQDQWLVSARILSNDEAAAQDLRASGFVSIETLLTLERDIPQSYEDHFVRRMAAPSDLEPCLAIARTAFSFDRFHTDNRVPDTAADRLKETWVANSLAGRADAVLVVDAGGKLGGFVTCMVNGDAAVIDLIAVDPGCQGQGLGKALVLAALHHYAGHKATLRVGTQDGNAQSLALYEGQGFVRIGSQVTYHWVGKATLQ